MEKHIDGVWHHRGFKVPGKLPKGFRRKEWEWQEIGWKEFQLVPKGGPPMPDGPVFYSEAPAMPTITKKLIGNTHAGYIGEALDKKN